jgi:peptide/nickel transport system ATP-binding protein
VSEHGSGLQIRGLVTRYGVGRASVAAVDRVDLDVPPGAVVGLVGESGSGKSTLARAIIGVAPVSGGSITLDGESLVGRGRAAARRRHAAQLVFQDPYDSLDPRMSVRESLGEGLRAGRRSGRAERRAETDRRLTHGGLEPALGEELPRSLSGGQRQRVAIARALAAEPRLLIADEITSALDVSVQGAVLNLVRDLHRRQGFAMLCISHNLAVVRYLADIIAVMYCGRIVEVGAAEQLVASPRHPYTRALVEAASPAALGRPAAGGLLPAEPADPRTPPPGCRFHPRCPRGPLALEGHERCRTGDPFIPSGAHASGVACFFPLPTNNSSAEPPLDRASIEA